MFNGNMKLNKSHASSVRHSHFFTHQVIINVWNSLPNSIVSSSTQLWHVLSASSSLLILCYDVAFFYFSLLGFLLEQSYPCLGALLTFYWRILVPPLPWSVKQFLNGPCSVFKMEIQGKWNSRDQVTWLRDFVFFILFYLIFSSIKAPLIKA